jgi:propionate catabolism operon transcriptional regulator
MQQVEDMKAKLFNIGVFISSVSLGNEINKIARKQQDNFSISHKSLEEAIPVGREMERSGVEVIVSRRGTANLLRENLQTPVLSFPQSSLSVMTSIKLATEGLKDLPVEKRKIFLPNSGTEVPGLELVEELLDIEFRQGIYFDSRSLEHIIFTAAREGFAVAIGGAATMRYALKYGLGYQELKTPIQDIIETIENAKSAALSNREEKATTHRYQSIMDLASDGIISVDSRGRLTTINRKARSVLGVDDKDAVGLPLSTLIRHDSLLKTLRNQTPVQDKIEQIGDELFVYNQEPLRMDDQTVGVVSTFREVSTVMRAENKVRRSLTKGFTAHYTLKDLVYRSPEMLNIVCICNELAKTNSTVLVTGETGTGKEVVAQSIHNCSRRKKMPFVSVHCGALSEQLLESELFGYEEGAFTGSKRGGKAGLFEMAHQGTIFLDEVDSTSHNVQLRLLRVLQEKEVMRIGGDRKVPVNVRVIAAAGKDLWSAVSGGLFRKDLFFRLNVLRVGIPPLRERKGDIPVLLNHFIRHHAGKLGIRPLTLPESYMGLLAEYSWPGNVRQLKHFAEQLCLNSMFEFSNTTLEALFKELSSIVDHTEPFIRQDPRQSGPSSLRLFDPESEAVAIYSALRKARFCRTKAAEFLGISRTTLWRKMKQLDFRAGQPEPDWLISSETVKKLHNPE